MRISKISQSLNLLKKKDLRKTLKMAKCFQKKNNITKDMLTKTRPNKTKIHKSKLRTKKMTMN